jgi:hypothetical protein
MAVLLGKFTLAQLLEVQHKARHSRDWPNAAAAAAAAARQSCC